MLDLTIAIPVKNEEVNIAGCIDSIGRDFVRKIVVIDSGSTDKTVEIVRSKNVEIINFQWDGKFPKKRNWYLRNHTPTTKWILFLDADEFLTPEFKEELKNALNDKRSEEIKGYWLRYSIYFLGKPLKGGYPLAKLALFQVGAGEYERIEENNWSNMDMEIHEHPIIHGKIGELRSKIDHRDFRGIDSYLKKHNEYAAWEAERYRAIKNTPELFAQFTWKQKLKYRLMNSFFIGPVFFIGSFIFMGGFRDGARGFVFAILKMSYFTQIYCRIKESQLL